MNGMRIASTLDTKGLEDRCVVDDLMRYLEVNIDPKLVAVLRKQISLLVDELEDLRDMANGVDELTSSLNDKFEQICNGEANLKDKKEEIEADFERIKELVKEPAEKS
ncbi:hypothetical protein KC723_01440 [Candidatus Kaiserbacteria bacterium]|nr:hypothetical protein [Candidatus Kaiserbacteria bacterium]